MYGTKDNLTPLDVVLPHHIHAQTQPHNMIWYHTGKRSTATTTATW